MKTIEERRAYHREYIKKWRSREKNKNKEKEYKKAYYEEHKLYYKEYFAKWVAEHREHYNALQLKARNKKKPVNHQVNPIKRVKGKFLVLMDKGYYECETLEKAKRIQERLLNIS